LSKSKSRTFRSGGRILKGKASVIESVLVSYVCLRKYSFRDSESTVIKTSLIVPPYLLPSSLSKSIGIFGLIDACLIGVSFYTIYLFLKPLFSFGNTTTVKNEHHSMFNGNITYKSS